MIPEIPVIPTFGPVKYFPRRRDCSRYMSFIHDLGCPDMTSTHEISCPPHSRFESRSRFTRISVLAAGAVLTLASGVVIIELLFGNWLSHDPWASTAALNVIRDRMIYYDVHQFYATSGNVIRYSRDQYGLRGTHRSPEDIDLLTVGGSTTDQHYIDDEETWQRILQDRLTAKLQRPYTVANAGVSGHTSYGHIASFDHWFPLIPHLAPRYILFYIGINDVFAGGTSVLDGNTNGTPGGINLMKHNSALYRLYTLWHGRVLALEAGLEKGKGLDGVNWTTVPMQSTGEAFYRASIERFGERVDRLLGRTRAIGAKAICATQPVRYFRVRHGTNLEGTAEIFKGPDGPLNGVDYYYKKRAIDREMVKRCQDAGAIVVDLASREWSDEDFYDYVHMVPRGTKKVGERLAEELAQYLDAGGSG